MTLRTPTTFRALAAAGLASLVLAAPAAADQFEYYGVTVDATVHTHYIGHESSAEIRHDSSLSLDTQVRSGFLAIVERAPGGRILGASGEDQHAATTTGTGTWLQREYDADYDDWYDYGSSCRGAGAARNDEGRTRLLSDPLAPLVGGALILNLADELTVEMACERTGRHGGAGPSSFRIESALPEDELSGVWGPLAVQFDLPEEAATAGKTIQLFEGPPQGHAAYCPSGLAGQAYTRECRVTFRGTITLEPTDLGIGRRTPEPPAPPAPPAPAPVPAPAPRPAPTPGLDDDLLAPLVPATQSASLNRSGSEVAFKAACPAGCAGTATLRLLRGRRRTLAVVRFAVGRSARPRTVRLTVPRRARGALRSARGATVKLVLRDRRSGRRVTRTLKLAK